MSANINPKHVEEDDLEEIYATNFQIAGTEQEMVMGIGTLDLSITEQGVQEIRRSIITLNSE